MPNHMGVQAMLRIKDKNLSILVREDAIWNEIFFFFFFFFFLANCTNALYCSLGGAKGGWERVS